MTEDKIELERDALVAEVAALRAIVDEQAVLTALHENEDVAGLADGAGKAAYLAWQEKLKELEEHDRRYGN